MARAARHTIVVGTRASKLALWQTNFVVARLSELFPELECRVQTFKTVGDDIVDRPLPELGGKGVFTARLEAALLHGDVDLAVHSLKDLPIEMVPGLTLGAITTRADARDVVITRDGKSLDALPQAAVVGTSSLRRQAQLLLGRPDLKMKQIRGNVETRLRKVMEGEYDATVLAAAGIDRLDLAAGVTGRLGFDVMLPAPGQGALAIQCRTADTKTLELLQPLNDARSRAAVEAERAFLSGLGGGCSAPVGALAEVGEQGVITMTGLVARPDGTRSVRVEGSGNDPIALGKRLAEESIGQGAREILDDAREALEKKLPLQGKRIVVTRAANQADELCAALSGMGAIPVRMPMIRIVPVADTATIDQVAHEASQDDWIVFTSANGVSAVWSAMKGDATPVFAGVRVAAVGPRTADALESRSVIPDSVPAEFTGEALAEALPDVSGRQVWLLRAETAGEAIVKTLTERGAVVHDVPVYRTEAEPIASEGLQELKKGVDAILFTSGSTARNFAAAWNDSGSDIGAFKKVAIACIGTVTAQTVEALGFNVAVIPDQHTTSALVDAVADHFSEVQS
jgi:hydroxymethylbilane synthase